MADNPAPIDAPMQTGTNRQQRAFRFVYAHSGKLLRIALENELVETRQVRRARERAQAEK